ncbi:LysE/ArgO family amino acid transporter [Streptomyces lividans]|uniref:Membrane transporter n=1 Tax=Streptomyces lividans TK24 TaxID=457428 RepID=A0ABM5QUX9_STRLI|nr:MULTISPECIES: LysE/ArgO family amino acid transporter [Streptomyces]QSJ07081.1 membrane transporter [Streptomyces lividans]AIJ11578.1 membrane transporter [Streptomyces lividans TK24]EFD64897.1 membrane transporter [Streptomyces lividans TK24]KKD15577.1 amino acid transporter [Streptomyces sp. WM6391]QTD68005.1 membrane transporter [Streptomyces lividans TK24] [Streptomyces lividans]
MNNALTAAAAGFGTGLSLIVAIGAQNAFVLRQGVRRDAVLAVVGICALSDAVLIALGVGGVGAVVVAWPGALTAVGLIGGAFLLCYGALAARRVFRPSGALRADGAAAGSRRRAVLTCLALTWLNPHVYLDTVFLLGSVAADRGPLRWTFGLGAAAASLVWFAALGFGARYLGRFLSRPAAWRVLDGLVAATMIVLGVSLVAGA